MKAARCAIWVAFGVSLTLRAFAQGTPSPAQQELRAALQEFARTAQSVRALTGYLERHPESALRGKSGPTRGAN